MITLIYCLILAMMVGGIAVIDIFLMKKTISEIYFYTFSLYGGTNKLWVVSALLMGFVLSIISDIYEYKKRQLKGLNNGQ